MPESVSVVIPTYNGEAWIAETLQSVFRQTRTPDEIIVVDDASTDGTVARVADIAVNAPVPVHLLRSESNSGSPAPTLNAGMAHASGDLIAILDQDDLFMPSKLEMQARTLAQDPGLAFVFSLYRCDDDERTFLESVAARLRVRRIRRRMIAKNGSLQCDGPVALEEFARSVNFIGGFPGFMFRRSAWKSKGGFDESLKIASDFEFLCWLCTQGAVALIPEVHYLRLEHGANLTFRTAIHWRLDAISVLLKFVDYSGTADIQHIVRGTINHHLWAVARRLASGGYRHAAGEVSGTVSGMVGSRWQAHVQRLAIPAYVAYYRIFRQPWKISADQANVAVRLAKAVAQRLA